MLTQAELKMRLQYDALTGVFTRLQTTKGNRFRVGIYLGCFQSAKDASDAYQAAKRQYHVSIG